MIRAVSSQPSKFQPQAGLDGAIAADAGDLAEISAGDGRVGPTQRAAVEPVEGVDAKLRVILLANREDLAEGQIFVPRPESPRLGIAVRRRAEGERCRVGEDAFVQVR